MFSHWNHNHYEMYYAADQNQRQKLRNSQIPDKPSVFSSSLFQQSFKKNEFQPNDQKTFKDGLAQEEVCFEILMIRTWDRQLLTCR